jgi:hypothetical protein
MPDVKSGLTTGPNNERMFPDSGPDASDFSNEALAARESAAPAERTPEPAHDLSLDSDESIVRSLVAPEVSKKIADGLTTDGGFEPERDKYGNTAEDRARIHEEFEAVRPEIERQSAERQLAALQGAALETYNDAVESGDEDERLAAALDLRALDPEMFMRVIRSEHERELGDRQDELDFYGGDESFAENYDEVMSEPTSALDLAEEVEAGYLTIKRTLERDQLDAERKQILTDRYGDEALENLEMYEMLRENVLEKPAEILGTNESAVRIHEHLSKAPSLLQQSPKDMERSLKFLEAIADEYLSVEQRDKREQATRTFHESILRAPSTSVSEGLETEQSRMTRAIQEQNALLRADQPAKPLNADKVAARAFDIPVDKPRRRRETAEEVRRSVAAPSSRSVEAGLTHNGKKTSSADIIARAQGFKSASDQREYERREESARTAGLLR